MKIKVLSRNPQDYVRETKRDIHRGNLHLSPSESAHDPQIMLDYLFFMSQKTLLYVLAFQFSETTTQICIRSKRHENTLVP